MTDPVSIAERWQERLAEARIGIGRGLEPDRLADRYDVESAEQIAQLTNRATVRAINNGYSTITLDDLDAAAEVLDIDTREVATDGGQSAGGTEWVCYPCSEVVPKREGRLTVHGDHDPDRLTVWCPWCGDKMDWSRDTDTDDDLRTDGGQFHSGDHHVLYDQHSPEREPDWRDICFEDDCTDRSHLACGCCGLPLCGRHHEVQGGFCSNFCTVAGVAGCLVWESEFYTLGLQFYDSENGVEVLEADGVYCLEEDGDPLCGGDRGADLVEMQTLEAESVDLCEDCEDVAVERLTDGADEDVDREVATDGGTYTLGSTQQALTNAEMRVQIAEVVGFDYQQRIDSRQSTSDHAVYFRAGDLVAICNWLRFHEDDAPEPVQRQTSKPEIVEEIGRRCGVEPRQTRFEGVGLAALLEHVLEVSDDE